MKERCPFCQEILPKHHRQCYHGGLPSANRIKDRQERKALFDTYKLKNTESSGKVQFKDNGGNKS